MQPLQKQVRGENAQKQMLQNLLWAAAELLSLVPDKLFTKSRVKVGKQCTSCSSDHLYSHLWDFSGFFPGISVGFQWAFVRCVCVCVWNTDTFSLYCWWTLLHWAMGLVLSSPQRALLAVSNFLLPLILKFFLLMKLSKLASVSFSPLTLAFFFLVVAEQYFATAWIIPKFHLCLFIWWMKLKAWTQLKWMVRKDVFESLS